MITYTFVFTQLGELTAVLNIRESDSETASTSVVHKHGGINVTVVAKDMADGLTLARSALEMSRPSEEQIVDLLLLLDEKIEAAQNEHNNNITLSLARVKQIRKVIDAPLSYAAVRSNSTNQHDR